MLMPLNIKMEASLYPSEKIFLPAQHCSEYMENFLKEPRISIHELIEECPANISAADKDNALNEDCKQIFPLGKNKGSTKFINSVIYTAKHNTYRIQ